MEYNEIELELEKTAKEIEDDNEKIASELLDVVDDIEEIKKASLMNPGDRITCCNPIQGIIKGRVYICGDIVKPNYAVICEDDGRQIGIFRLDRFVPYNYED